jgi:hypothetical protein
MYGKRILAGLALALMVAGAPASVAAQEAPGTEKITMSPSSRTIKADAGSTVQESLEIHNTGTVPFDFRVYASPYGVKGEQYDPEFSDAKPNQDVHKWAAFARTEYSLKPGEKTEVKYTLAIPGNAAPGGHYGVIFAETKAQALGDTGVERQKRVGQVIYATINGNYKTEGSLVNFVLPFWQTKSPMVSSARVANSGNVDFEADVRTVAKDMLGRTKFEYIGDPIILPDTTRLVEMAWKDAPNFGLFSVSQTVKFLGQEHTHKGMVLIAPRWFPLLILVFLAAGAAYAIAVHKKKRR